MNTESSPLPYRDTKAVGAADFYFAINATFRFILERLGEEGLRRYWTEMGSQYFAPVSEALAQGGLPAMAAYWRAFFAAEPGGEAAVSESEHTVELTVTVCPAIQHLRTHGRDIVACFCQHCYFIQEAMVAPAGYTIRIAGGNGSCRQTIHSCDQAPVAQDLRHIHSATSEATC